MIKSISEEPPRKKTKKLKEEKLPSTLFSSLPDEVVQSCFARVSRWDHGALSLVSKSFKSLIASPDLHSTRSLMSLTENYLYVCLRTPPPPSPSPVSTRWFICRFEKNLDGAVASKKRLCQIPSSPCHPLESSVVSFEWGIYVIGGKIDGKPTTGVMLLDCRSHKWHQVTSMRVARACAAAGVVDGKIYVFGGCKAEDPWGEVFDPKTQTWDSLPILNLDTDYNLAESTVDASSPSDGNWEKENFDSWCVIDDLLYCEMLNTLFWSEPEVMEWKKLKGLKSLRRRLEKGYKLIDSNGKVTRDCMSKNGISGLSNFGGNMMVFWDEVPAGYCDGSFEIWCAEISLGRDEEGEIRGKIMWSDALITTDNFLYSSDVLYSVSVNV